jgi:hypothetical protein
MIEDSIHRVMDAESLARMCDAESGVSHTLRLEIGRTRARITYSNPDEYGSPRPYVAEFPAWRESGRVFVLLRLVRDYGAEDEHGRESCWQYMNSAIMSARFIRPDGSRDARPPLVSHFVADTLRRAAELARAIEAGEMTEDARRVAARDVIRSCDIVLES